MRAEQRAPATARTCSLMLVSIHRDNLKLAADTAGPPRFNRHVLLLPSLPPSSLPPSPPLSLSLGLSLLPSPPPSPSHSLTLLLSLSVSLCVSVSKSPLLLLIIVFSVSVSVSVHPEPCSPKSCTACYEPRSLSKNFFQLVMATYLK